MGHRRVLALVGISSLLLSVAMTATADAVDPPQPVASLTVQPAVGSSGGDLYVSWTKSPDADEAEVCWEPGATAPTDPVPGGTTHCDAPTPDYDDTIEGQEGAQYGVSVFSYDSSTTLYGAPLSDVVTANYKTPATPAIAYERAVGPRAVKVRWRQENGETWEHTTAWLVQVRKGAGKGHTTKVKVRHIVLRDLVPGQSYTVEVTPVAVNGRHGEPTSIRVAARTPASGLSVRHQDGWKRSILPATKQARSDAVGELASGNRIQALYVAHDQRLEFTSAAPGGRWDKPVRLANVAPDVLTPRLARSPDGTLVAAWENGLTAHLRVRPAGSTRWRPDPAPDLGQTVGIDAAVLDAKHRVHLLIDEGNHLVYATDASGNWTTTVVPHAVAIDGALASDPRHHTIVAAYVHASTRNGLVNSHSLQVTEISDRATSIGAGKVVLRRAIQESIPPQGGLAIHGEAITQPSIALSKHRVSVSAVTEPAARAGRPPSGTPLRYVPSSGLFVFTGKSVGDLGHQSTVPDSHAPANHLMISAAGSRLMVTWSRSGPVLNANEGVYAATAHLARGRWQFGRPQRVLAGHYATAGSGFFDRRGDLAVVTTVAAINPPPSY